MKTLAVFLFLASTSGVYSNCGCLKCNAHLKVISAPGSPVTVISKHPVSCPEPPEYDYHLQVPEAPPRKPVGAPYRYQILPGRVENPAPCNVPQAHNYLLQVPVAPTAPGLSHHGYQVLPAKVINPPPCSQPVHHDYQLQIPVEPPQPSGGYYEYKIQSHKAPGCPPGCYSGLAVSLDRVLLSRYEQVAPTKPQGLLRVLFNAPLAYVEVPEEQKILKADRFAAKSQHFTLRGPYPDSALVRSAHKRVVQLSRPKLRETHGIPETIPYQDILPRSQNVLKINPRVGRIYRQLTKDQKPNSGVTYTNKILGSTAENFIPNPRTTTIYKQVFLVPNPERLLYIYKQPVYNIKEGNQNCQNSERSSRHSVYDLHKPVIQDCPHMIEQKDDQKVGEASRNSKQTQTCSEPNPRQNLQSSKAKIRNLVQKRDGVGENRMNFEEVLQDYKQRQTPFENVPNPRTDPSSSEAVYNFRENTKGQGDNLYQNLENLKMKSEELQSYPEDSKPEQNHQDKNADKNADVVKYDILPFENKGNQKLQNLDKSRKKLVSARFALHSQKSEVLLQNPEHIQEDSRPVHIKQNGGLQKTLDDFEDLKDPRNLFLFNRQAKSSVVNPETGTETQQDSNKSKTGPNVEFLEKPQWTFQRFRVLNPRSNSRLYFSRLTINSKKNLPLKLEELQHNFDKDTRPQIRKSIQQRSEVNKKAALREPFFQNSSPTTPNSFSFSPVNSEENPHLSNISSSKQPYFQNSTITSYSVTNNIQAKRYVVLVSDSTGYKIFSFNTIPHSEVDPYLISKQTVNPIGSKDISRSKRSINWKLLALKPNRPPVTPWTSHRTMRRYSADDEDLPQWYSMNQNPKRPQHSTWPRQNRKPHVYRKSSKTSPHSKIKQLNKKKKNSMILKAALKKTNRFIKEWFRKGKPLNPPEIQYPDGNPKWYESVRTCWPSGDEKTAPKRKLLNFKKLGRSRRAIRARKNERFLPPSSAPEDSNEVDDDVALRRQRRVKKLAKKPAKGEPSDPFLEPLKFDHIFHPVPLIHLLNAPVRYLNHLHKLKLHVKPVVGTIPKVIRVSKRYFFDFLKNLGKNAIHLGTDLVGGFLRLGKLKLLPTRRLKRHLDIPQLKGSTDGILHQLVASLTEALRRRTDASEGNKPSEVRTKRDAQTVGKGDSEHKVNFRKNLGENMDLLFSEFLRALINKNSSLADPVEAQNDFTEDDDDDLSFSSDDLKCLTQTEVEEEPGAIENEGETDDIHLQQFLNDDHDENEYSVADLLKILDKSESIEDRYQELLRKEGDPYLYFFLFDEDDDILPTESSTKESEPAAAAVRISKREAEDFRERGDDTTGFEESKGSKRQEEIFETIINSKSSYPKENHSAHGKEEFPNLFPYSEDDDIKRFLAGLSHEYAKFLEENSDSANQGSFIECSRKSNDREDLLQFSSTHDKFINPKFNVKGTLDSSSNGKEIEGESEEEGSGNSEFIGVEKKYSNIPKQVFESDKSVNGYHNFEKYGTENVKPFQVEDWVNGDIGREPAVKQVYLERNPKRFGTQTQSPREVAHLMGGIGDLQDITKDDEPENSSRERSSSELLSEVDLLTKHRDKRHIFRIGRVSRRKDPNEQVDNYDGEDLPVADDAAPAHPVTSNNEETTQGSVIIDDKENLEGFERAASVSPNNKEDVTAFQPANPIHSNKETRENSEGLVFVEPAPPNNEEEVVEDSEYAASVSSNNNKRSGQSSVLTKPILPEKNKEAVDLPTSDEPLLPKHKFRIFRPGGMSRRRGVTERVQIQNFNPENLPPFQSSTSNSEIAEPQETTESPSSAGENGIVGSSVTAGRAQKESASRGQTEIPHRENLSPSNTSSVGNDMKDMVGNSGSAASSNKAGLLKKGLVSTDTPRIIQSELDKQKLPITRASGRLENMSSHSKIPVHTILGKISQISGNAKQLANADLSVHADVYQSLIKLQILKNNIVEALKSLVAEKGPAASSERRAHLVGKLREAQNFKEAILHEIAPKLNNYEQFSTRIWIRALIRLQKFHCLIRTLLHCLGEGQKLDVAKIRENANLLHRLDLISSTNLDMVLTGLGRDRDVEILKEMALMESLEGILKLKDSERKLVEDKAKIIWEINNIEKLQGEAIAELKHKLSRGLRTRRELRILFDLQKQLESCEERQKTLL